MRERVRLHLANGPIKSVTYGSVHGFSVCPALWLQCNRGMGVTASDWLWSAVGLVGLAGCGAGGLVSPRVSPAATASSPPATSDSPSPLPTPTPIDSTTLAVIDNVSVGLEAVDGSGRVQWTLSSASLGAQLGETGRVVGQTVAGPNLLVDFELGNAAATQDQLVVVNSSGRVLGKWASPIGIWADGIVGSPSGTEWAWTFPVAFGRTEGGPGKVMVAGLNEASRDVYDFVAPAGYWEELAAWTDTGIIMERVGSGGCGYGFHNDFASFVVNPTTRTLSDLFSNGWHYLDARSGVKVATLGLYGSIAEINGVEFDEPGDLVAGAYISPDGQLVAISRILPEQCVGGSGPGFRVEMVQVNGDLHWDINGEMAEDWWSPSAFLGRPQTHPSYVRAYDRNGKLLATLWSGDSGSGYLVGVLRAG